MSKDCLKQHKHMLVIGFTAFLLWSDGSLLQLDRPQHYDFSILACMSFIIAFIAAALILHFCKFNARASITAILSFCGCVLSSCCIFHFSGIICAVAVCANQALCAIVLLWWAQCFLTAQTKTVHGFVVVAGIVFCAILLLGFINNIIIDVLHAIAPLVAGVCTLVYSKQEKRVGNFELSTDKDTSQESNGNKSSAKTEKQSKRIFSSRSNSKNAIWLFTILIQISVLISSIFINMLYNPFVINSQGFGSWQALCALVVLCILVFARKLSSKVTIFTCCFIALVALVLALLLFISGAVGFIAAPVIIIGAANILLYIFTWALLMDYMPRGVRAGKLMTIFVISILASSGILGRLIGFSALRAFDPSFAMLKTLAEFLAVIYALLFIAYIVINAYLQRQEIAKVSEEEIAAVKLESAHSAELSREARAQKCCEDHALTERETEAIVLLAQGMTRSMIAESWVVSENTVKYHLRNAYKKLDVHNARELNSLIDSTKLN